MSSFISSSKIKRVFIALGVLSSLTMTPAYSSDSSSLSGVPVGIDDYRYAQPQTSNSATKYFPNGQPIRANAWIQPIAKGGCGNFATSVVMDVSPSSITNNTSFYQWGVKSIKIGPVNIESSRKGPDSLSWTNYNGAKGSYLSGSVCGGWGTLYTGVDVSGGATYNGTWRGVATRI